MQFRKQGKRIQVLGYRGYDRDKRRAKVEFLGSIDSTTYAPTVGLIESLTVDEKIELQSWIDKDRQSHTSLLRVTSMQYFDSNIDFLVDSLSDDTIASHMTDEHAQRIYAALDRLSRIMRKRGYVRKTATKSP